MGVTGLVCLRKPSRVQHSHARLRALQNLDFKRLTLTHAQFGLYSLQDERISEEHHL